jgi:predicted DNA-binding mobile mystery protein A
MKSNTKKQHQQRQILDQKIKMSPAQIKNGWIKSVRNSLGISARQLASMMGANSNIVSQIESGEIKKTLSLKNLSRAAEAMDCELVYMIVPKKNYKSFDDILEKKSQALAQKIATGVTHSMDLEQQHVELKITNSQIKVLAQDLKNKLDSRMWIPNPKIKK